MPILLLIFLTFRLRDGVLLVTLPYFKHRNGFTKLITNERILSQIILVDISPFRGLISKSRGGNARMVGAFPLGGCFPGAGT